MFDYVILIYGRIVEYFTSLGNSFGVSANDVALLFFSIIAFFIVKLIYPEKKKEKEKEK